MWSGDRIAIESKSIRVVVVTTPLGELLRLLASTAKSVPGRQIVSDRQFLARFAAET